MIRTNYHKGYQHPDVLDKTNHDELWTREQHDDLVRGKRE